MGRNVDLGQDVNKGTPKTAEELQKQKMIYMNIPTVTMLMIDIKDYPNCRRYVKAFVQSIRNSMSKRELRKELFKTFGVKTLKKMQRLKPKELELLKEIYGDDIWGE